MDHIKRIFKSVNTDNVDELWEKAYSSATILRIFALLSMILMIVLTAFVTYIYLETPIVIKNVDPQKENLAMLLIFLLLGISIFEYVYISKIKKKIKNKENPSLILPTIFLILSIISLMNDIKKITIIAMIFSVFSIYLWSVMIISIRKIKKINKQNIF